jgi:hypothetical protein
MEAQSRELKLNSHSTEFDPKTKARLMRSKRLIPRSTRRGGESINFRLESKDSANVRGRASREETPNKGDCERLWSSLRFLISD